MAVEDPPGVLNSDTTPSKVQRHTTQGLLGVPVGAFAGGVGAGAGGGHGVVGATDLNVTQSAAPGMSVDVAKGIAFVVGTVSAEQGPYSFYNDATVTLSISPAHATLVRRDLIVAQIQDADYSGAVRSARLLVVTGTAGSGVDPSLSGTPNALVLARVTVPAAASSILNANITDLRTRAYALGGVGNFADAAARDLAITAPTEGMLAYLRGSNVVTWHDGTNWQGDWANYTPTDAFITVGNGTRVARWKWGIDGMVDFEWVLILGSTSAIAANAAVGLPRAAVTVTGLEQTISIRYLDNGTRHYLGGAQIGSGGSTAQLLHTEAGDSGTVSATSPFTWTTGDKIVVTGRYQPTP